MSLVHDRTDDGFNFVASGEYRPPDAVKESEIGSGRYVYSLVAQQQFCNPEDQGDVIVCYNFANTLTQYERMMKILP